MSGLPLVAVFPNPMSDGLDKLSDMPECRPGTLVTIQEAFEGEWPTDAHFHLYTDCTPGNPTYRTNKGCLSEYRTSKGSDLHVHFIALDWDRPTKVLHKQGWTSESFQEFRTILEPLAASQTPFGELLRSCMISYSTRGGWRWVYRLSKGVPVDDAEPLIRGLAAEFAANLPGTDQTPVVLTWSQPFRLPRVVRDGKKSSDSEFFRSGLLNLEAALESTRITPLGEVDRLGRQTVDATRPDVDQIKDLLETQYGNRTKKPTTFVQKIKKRLQGQPYYECLFNDAPLPESTARHDLLRDWIMSVAGYVAFLEEGTQVEQVYALFYKITEDLDAKETEKRNWFREIWRLCTGAWSRAFPEAQAAREAAKKEEEKAAVAYATVSESITAGVRVWYPKLPEDPTEAWAWIKSKLIVLTRRSHFIMLPSGYYSKHGVDRDELVPAIKQRGMDSVILLKRSTKNGDTRPASYSEILEESATVVAEVEAYPEIEGGFLTELEAEMPKLIILSWRRSKTIIPKFNQDVDDWLRHMAGFDKHGISLHSTLNRHLGCFIASERGATAAMGFVTPPGAGKNLLARGLVETLETPCQALGKDLKDNFNAALLNSPYVLVNEGFPPGIGANQVADMTRAIITGDPVPINQKHKPIVQMNAPHRVMLMANNDGIYLELGYGKDLSLDDQVAIGIRLYAYDPGDAPGNFLKSKGGRAFTQGWVEGPGKEPSQFILAAHLLWLYEQYGKNAVVGPGGRFIFEGDPDSAPVQLMRTQGATTLEVLDIICAALKEDMLDTGPTSSDMRIHEGGLYVTTGGVHTRWKNSDKGRSAKLDIKKIGNALKGITAKDCPSDHPWRVAGTGIQQRWHKIDVELLEVEAAKQGSWQSQRLNDLLVEFRKRKAEKSSG